MGLASTLLCLLAACPAEASLAAPEPPAAMIERHEAPAVLEKMEPSVHLQKHDPGCERIAGDPPLDRLDRYDCLIREAIVHECHELDPREVKRQMWQESSGRVRVVSHAGAKGLMQLLEPTFRSMSPRGDIFDPEDNIRAGVAYRCWGAKFWHAGKRSEAERHGPLSLLIYNAGPKGGLDAQAECGGYTWAEFGPCAPAETRHYVAVIWRPDER